VSLFLTCLRLACLRVGLPPVQDSAVTIDVGLPRCLERLRGKPG
jgi:hypothetical protein